MGLFTALFGNKATKTTEVVKLGYNQGLKFYETQMFSPSEKKLIDLFNLSPHKFGLYRTQVLLYGDPKNDLAKAFAIVAELLPFLYLKESVSLEALLSYRLFKAGCVEECDVNKLKDLLIKVLNQVSTLSPMDENTLNMLVFCSANENPPLWFDKFLDEQTQQKLTTNFNISKCFRPGNIPQLFLKNSYFIRKSLVQNSDLSFAPI